VLRHLFVLNAASKPRLLLCVQCEVEDQQLLPEDRGRYRCEERPEAHREGRHGDGTGTSHSTLWEDCTCGILDIHTVTHPPASRRIVNLTCAVSVLLLSAVCR